jgi:hypothetical protein
MLWTTECRFPAAVGVRRPELCRPCLAAPRTLERRHPCDGGRARAAPSQVRLEPGWWEPPSPASEGLGLPAPASAAEWEAGHASTRPGSGNPCPSDGMSRTARFRCIWPYATYIRHRHGSLWPCVAAAAVLIRPRRLVGTRRSSTGMRRRMLHRPAVALLAWDPRQQHQQHGMYRWPWRQGVTIPSTGRTRAGPLPLFVHVALPLPRTRRRELSFSESRQRKSVASNGAHETVGFVVSGERCS